MFSIVVKYLYQNFLVHIMKCCCEEHTLFALYVSRYMLRIYVICFEFKHSVVIALTVSLSIITALACKIRFCTCISIRY